MDSGFFDRACKAIASVHTRRSFLTVALASGVTAVAQRSVPVSGVGVMTECPGDRVPLANVGVCSRKVPKIGYVPIGNGCGPENGPKVPGNYLGVDFTPACQAHDICWGTCGADRRKCDENFLSNLLTICERNFFVLSRSRARCNFLARSYALAVGATEKGNQAYAAAQLKACDCCIVSSSCYRCNCNNQVYSNSHDCITTCKASLGCFTGICAPVPCE